jgi:hypothetical protein
MTGHPREECIDFSTGRIAHSPFGGENKRAQRIELSAPSLSLQGRVIKSKKIGLGISPALKSWAHYRHQRRLLSQCLLFELGSESFNQLPVVA